MLFRSGITWDDQLVTFFVRDSGPGIAPEDIDHVFDRFYKADKSHRQPGTGLGLAIAREILRMHHQEIWVTSQLGQGSVFYFTLRRADGSTKPEITNNNG